MATTYLTRTPSSSGSNTTWTFSAWIKRSALGLDTVPFATGYSSPQIDESIINIGDPGVSDLIFTHKSLC